MFRLQITLPERPSCPLCGATLSECNWVAFAGLAICDCCDRLPWSMLESQVKHVRVKARPQAWRIANGLMFHVPLRDAWHN